jgi:hypothetical protein
MKAKEIQVGESYVLIDNKHSNCGCSSKYFDMFKNNRVTVLKKLNGHNIKNNLLVQGYQEKDESCLIRFWCSTYDLKGE